MVSMNAIAPSGIVMYPLNLGNKKTKELNHVAAVNKDEMTEELDGIFP